MLSHVEEFVEVVERQSPAVSSAPPAPSYEVRWTTRQKVTRWLMKPLVWLQRRAYRRFMHLFAPYVAFWLSELPIVFTVVSTLVRFRIFDRLENGPQSSEDLAAATGTNHDALQRLLRTAAVLCFLKRQKDGLYALNPVGRQFLSNSPVPVAPWTELLDRVVLLALPYMPEAIVKGEALPKAITGKTCWELMSEHPGTTELHDKACGGWTELIVDNVAKTYDFSAARTVVDVGGGRGAFLAAMLKSAPHLTGRVYDRETTKLAAQARFQKEGVANRAAHECGNFFESVPAGADLYTIKHALHDWDDESALTILRNIRRAVPAHGKLLIVEGSVEHDLQPSPSLRAIWDVTQFVATWGKSRTLQEFSDLAHRAGFRLANIYVPNAFDALIMECVPIDQPAASPRTPAEPPAVASLA